MMTKPKLETPKNVTGRIIHRAAYSLNRGRFDASTESKALTPRATGNTETSASGEILTLVPGRNSKGLSVLGSVELPVFCPDSKHAASLQRISHVCADLEYERTRLLNENAEATRKKGAVLEELGELEERIRALLDRKVVLEGDLLSAEASERRGLRLIEGLDEKIDAIGDSSVRFEEAVRSIAGEAHYELEHGGASPVKGLPSQSRKTLPGGSHTTAPISSKVQPPPYGLSSTISTILEAHSGGVTCLVRSDSSNEVVTAGIDGKVRLWDGSRPMIEALVGPEASPISCVAMEGNRIVIGNVLGSIFVWERETGIERLTIDAHKGEVTCISLQDGDILSGGADYALRQFCSSTGTLKKSLLGHTGKILCLQSFQHAAASGAADHTVKFWDLRMGHCTHTLRGHGAPVQALQFDGERILSGDAEGVIKLWDLRDKSLLVSANTGSTIHGMCFQGESLICGVEDGRVMEFSLEPSQVSYRGIVTDGHKGAVTAVVMDAWRVYSAGKDGTVRVTAREGTESAD